MRSYITVDQSIIPTKVTVSLDFTATDSGDVSSNITGHGIFGGYYYSPPACASDGVDIVLDDDAATSINDVCPGDGQIITGTYIPSAPFTPFEGSDAQGSWKIDYTDNATLTEWCVIFYE
jgi:hypothetical protein